MPDDPGARRFVPRDAIARLAEILDRFEHADDPLSPEVQQAERAFDAEVDRLFVEFVVAQDLRLRLSDFRGHVAFRCKQRLIVERKQPPALPPG